MKKFWAAAVLSLLLSMVTFAEERETFTSGDFEYVVLEDGTAEITHYSGDEEVLDVPQKLDGYGVTSIGDIAFENRKSLSSITLPDSVTSIGDSAFDFCSSLSSITLPEGMTSIGGMAFGRCFSLSSITLPESTRSIAFSKR